MDFVTTSRVTVHVSYSAFRNVFVIFFLVKNAFCRILILSYVCCTSVRLYRSSAIEELLGGAVPRRRSGSISSTSGVVSGAGPSGMSSNDLDYKSSSLNSWVLSTRSTSSSMAGDAARRIVLDVDDDASSTASGYSTTRSRRAGSLVRDRTTSYLSDADTPRMMVMDSTPRSSYLLPGGYDTSSYERSTITYPPPGPQSSFQTRSYYQQQQSDYGATSPAPSYYASYYGGGGGGESRSSYGLYSSSFSGRASNDPSRFRRAQSVSDFTPSADRSLSSDRGGASAYNQSSTGGAQFQSRFLDKVRARKSYGDDQSSYKSRFLSSDPGSGRHYSGRLNYNSTDE